MSFRVVLPGAGYLKEHQQESVLFSYFIVFTLFDINMHHGSFLLRSYTLCGIELLASSSFIDYLQMLARQNVTIVGRCVADTHTAYSKQNHTPRVVDARHF